MSKFNFDSKDGKLSFSVDANEDGESSLKGSLSLSEGVAEIFKRGEAKDGVKIVDFKFELTKLYLKIDSDQDGEEVFSIEVDLAEAFDEVKGLFAKKD